MEIKSQSNEYFSLHAWLRRKYGSASKCEITTCKRKPNRYYWALRKGFTYQRERENFIQLCMSCHQKQDYTEERREKARINMAKMSRNNNKGELSPFSKLTEFQVLEIRRVRKKDHSAKVINLSKEYNVSVNTIYRIIRREKWKHI